MADNTLLFDSARCTGCKRCQMVCSAQRGLKGGDEGASSVTAPVAPWAPDVDGNALMALTYLEQAAGEKGFQYTFSRKSCMHCRDAACVRVCPTGAMAVDEETGFVRNRADRCVSCGLCETVCPFDVPRLNEAQRRVVKCDGCADAVASGGVPLCVGACSTGALLFGERADLLEEGQQRVAALQEQGFADACLFGATEQGGLRVLEVLKYGLAGVRGEVLADTGSNKTVQAVELTGPASLGVLGALTVGGIVLFGYGMKQPKR